MVIIMVPIMVVMIPVVVIMVVIVMSMMVMMTLFMTMWLVMLVMTLMTIMFLVTLMVLMMTTLLVMSFLSMLFVMLVALKKQWRISKNIKSYNNRNWIYKMFYYSFWPSYDRLCDDQPCDACGAYDERRASCDVSSGHYHDRISSCDQILSFRKISWIPLKTIDI